MCGSYKTPFYKGLAITCTMICTFACLELSIIFAQFTFPLAVLPESIILPERSAIITAPNKAQFCVDYSKTCYPCPNNRTYKLIKTSKPIGDLYPVPYYFHDYQRASVGSNILVYWDQTSEQTGRVYWNNMYMTHSSALYYFYYWPQKIYEFLLWKVIAMIVIIPIATMIMFCLWQMGICLDWLVKETWKTFTVPVNSQT